jgi:hypothetical protein
MSGESIGWWGCLSCGRTVPNNHTGPCPLCGERIGRVLPAVAAIHVRATAHRKIRESLPQVRKIKSSWTLGTIAAAAVLIFGSPILSAASAGWDGVQVGMALNIWSASVGYYALAMMRGSEPIPS